MILFVDDESVHVDSYIQELRLTGYQVEHVSNVDDALGFLEKCIDKINLLILDIIVPPGLAFKSIDTALGLRTGIAFFERTRHIRPDLPVIILTNVSAPEVKERFASEDNCLFLRKEDYYPFELCDEVKDLLSSCS